MYNDTGVEKIVIRQTEYNGSKSIYRPQTFKVTLLTCNKTSLIFELEEISVKLTGQSFTLDCQGTILSGKAPQEYDFACLMNSCDQGYGIFTMDDPSVFFFEKYLGELPDEFGAMKLLVTLDILFKMMENGLYSIKKL